MHTTTPPRVILTDVVSSDRRRVNVMSYGMGVAGLNNHYPPVTRRPAGVTLTDYLASCVRDALVNGLPSYSHLRRELANGATVKVYEQARGTYRYVVTAAV